MGLFEWHAKCSSKNRPGFSIVNLKSRNGHTAPRDEEQLNMPILSGLRRQFAEVGTEEWFALNNESGFDGGDETLISDARSGMRSKQIIERKLAVAISREYLGDNSNTVASGTRFEQLQ
jgi:hypothetical protein